MLKLYPRRKLFIAWADLLSALLGCAVPHPRGLLEKTIENLWQGSKKPLSALSVRTLLDASLTALALEQGSEILISSITIADIPEIIKAHGLVPVPIELDPFSLAPRNYEKLEKSVSKRSKAILIAPLFGSLIKMDDLAALAKRHNLLLIEDLAQAYRGPNFHGHPDSDIVLFSFGPIKTSSALGGAIGLFKSPALAEQVRKVVEAFKPYSNYWFFRRSLKFMLLKLLSKPYIFGIFAKSLEALGINWERFLSGALRSFPQGQMLARIRRQAPTALLGLLYRRLVNFNQHELQEQRELAQNFANQLDAANKQIGSGAYQHDFWVFPFLANEPQQLINELRRNGFDAVNQSSLITLNNEASQTAANWLHDVVFLPVYSEMPASDLTRMSHVIRSVTCQSKHTQAMLT